MLARFTFRKAKLTASRLGSWVSKASNCRVLVKSPTALALALMTVTLAISVFVINANDRSASNQPLNRPLSPGSANSASITQAAALPRGKLRSLLSFQPEADRFRRLIGRRFLSSGREVSIMSGALTIGGSRHSVTIVRTQNADGEDLSISLDGNPQPLTWDDKHGAKEGSGLAAGERRVLIERIALDSPDQFIMAQTRGATYETIAQQVRPAEAGGADDYKGSVWDLVSVTEPSSSDSEKSLSEWRVYYINSVTRLIDKVISQEEGQRIVTEISGWGDQGGEKFPTSYVWKNNNQTLMILSVTSVTFNAKQ